jgi:YidC/Oxa1 family membrane protein insertase
MSKKDVLILVALFAFWILWAPIDRMIIKPLFFPDAPVAEETAGTEPAPREPEPMAPTALDDEPASTPIAVPAEPAAVAPQPATEPVAELAASTSLTTPPPAREPAARHTVETEQTTIHFSSLGGTIEEIVLRSYPLENRADSPPIAMDFAGVAALGLEGLAGLTGADDFELTPLADGVQFTRTLPYGLRWTRTITAVDDYVFEVRDTMTNVSGTALQLPGYGIRTGRMLPMPGSTSMYGTFPVGVDTLLPAESVQRWAKQLPKWLKDTAADVVRRPLQTPVDWVAVKNKYFVQSLRPRDLATENAVVYVARDAQDEVGEVWATLQFPSSTLAAGDSFTREYVYYAGPQLHDRLSALGYHQDRIMELGWAPIRFFATLLIGGLGFLYSLLGNYGVAIMLLTVIIRIIFWPLTHKGTESMRRMQEISPLMKEVNEKFKDDPQKKQQAMMQLYKQHKVNPLGGCLPMLVQIPVFIGLFYVLRTAIELRYAGFLWISDLSEPEGILKDVLPLPLNLLPIFMAITMYFQQKLTPTPTGGDEKQMQVQQTMMRVMPVMMLVMLYNFAAGLALYWSTQNVLMIVQQLLYRRRRARQEAAQAGA